jgi:hypothetical protein
MGLSHLRQKPGFVVLPKSAYAKGKAFETRVDRNGIIHVVERRKPAFNWAPVKLVCLFLLLVTTFKALALFNVGMNDYNDRLALLESGTLYEQAGAVLLRIDPVTESVYTAVRPLLR